MEWRGSRSSVAGGVAPGTALSRPRADTPVPGPPAPEMSSLDRVACDGCGRWFSTIDGAAMLACIKGECPDCGGSFGLMEDQASR